MTELKISIIGNGFVGNAINQGLKNHFDIKVFDIDQSKSTHPFRECSSADIIFVCVPTPSKDESFDMSYVEDVVSKMNNSSILVVKSTITPEAATKLVEKFSERRFVFNPEFLTERTAVEDFVNQKRIVLGGNEKDTSLVADMYKKVFPNCHYIETDVKTACFIKYFCNCFFASKVSLMNEFYQVAEKEGINWGIALDGLLSSGWVNQMHTNVPGPDGSLGFGGKCFPKDMVAYSSYVEGLGVDPKIVKAAWEKNLEIRIDRNWEAIPGAMKK